MSLRAPFLVLAAAAASLFALFAEFGGWPDPVREAWRRARASLEQDDPGATWAALIEARRAWPRSGRLHTQFARFARSRGAHDLSLAEHERAVACDPFHGDVRARAARAFLLEAVKRSDDDLLEAAADHFSVAVEVGHVPFGEVLTAFEAAGAPLELFERAAGEDPARLELLLRHQARLLRRDEALRLGRLIDERRGGIDREGETLAHVRIAAAARAEGDSSLAAEHFEKAAALARRPDAFALDHADVLLEIGRTEKGAWRLLRATRVHELTPSRVAASLLSSPEPIPAVRALGRIALERDDIARFGAAEAARRLGDSSLLAEVIGSPATSTRIP